MENFFFCLFYWQVEENFNKVSLAMRNDFLICLDFDTKKTTEISYHEKVIFRVI